MDRSLDDVISERQKTRPRSGRGRGDRYDDRRDNGRKPPMRDGSRNLDKDAWVHDRYEGDRFTERETRETYETRDARDRRSDRPDRYEPGSDSIAENPGKLRVDNLHYDLNETDLRELFTRIGPLTIITILYDRSGRSRGTAYVTYASLRDANRAIREFDGANAYGQPINLTLMPSGPGSSARGGSGRLDSGPGRSLFDRIDGGRGGRPPPRRGRSESPARDRRTEILREEVPEGIDRYIPGAGSRPPRSRSPTSARRRGRGGSRRDEGSGRGGKDTDGRLVVQGRPRKTAEELDAEMENYWGGDGATPKAVDASGNVGMSDAGTNGPSFGATAAAPASAPVSAPAPALLAGGDDDIDMIE